jgi:hypothetical protein
MAKYKLLHTKELYRQWYNLCNLFPDKVHPAWGDPSRVNYGSTQADRILRYQSLDANKETGYYRFLYDMDFEKGHIQNTFLGGGYVSSKYYRGRTRLKCYVVPRPQVTIGYMTAPSQRKSGEKVEQNDTSTRVRHRIHLQEGEFETEGIPIDEEDNQFILRRPNPCNTTAQFIDTQQVSKFTFSKETVQIIHVPESVMENFGWPDIDEAENEFGWNYGVFSRQGRTQVHSRLPNVTNIDLCASWYIRTSLPAYGRDMVLTPEEFKLEHEIDGFKVVDTEAIGELLSRGFSGRDILELSKDLSDAPDPGEINKVVTRALAGRPISTIEV